MLSSRVCPSVRLSVRHKPGLYRNDLTDTAGLGMGASLEPMLHCAVRKFGYLQNKDTSLWNLPQTLLGLRKFSSRQVDRVVNESRRLWSLWIRPMTVERVVAGCTKFIIRWSTVTH